MSVFVVVRGVLIAFDELSCKLGAAVEDKCHWLFKGKLSFCFFQKVGLTVQICLSRFFK